MDLNPANVAIGGVLLTIFAVFAIIANIMIIVIYTRKNMRSPINTTLTGKYLMIILGGTFRTMQWRALGDMVLGEHGPWGAWSFMVLTWGTRS